MWRLCTVEVLAMPWMDASTAVLTEHLSLTQPFVFSFLHGVLAEQALQAGLFSF